MADIVTTVIGFFEANAVWLGVVSVVSFIVGLTLAPLLVARIPEDYFSHPHRQRWSASSRHPAVRLALAGVKNLLGGMLVLAGLIMLVTPGQGLLTLLAGLVIMNYPGKFALERWLITRPTVLPAVNWLRSRRNSAPLQAPRGKRQETPPAGGPS